MDEIKAIVRALGKIGLALGRIHRARKAEEKKAMADIHRTRIETLVYLKQRASMERHDSAEEVRLIAVEKARFAIAEEARLAMAWTEAAVEIRSFSKELYKLCRQMADQLVALDPKIDSLRKITNGITTEIDGVETVTTGNGYYKFQIDWNTLDMEAVNSRANKRFPLFAGKPQVSAPVGPASKRTKKKYAKEMWSKDDIELLRRFFPNQATADVALILNRPTGAVKRRASQMGLRKSKNYMRGLGRA